MIVRFRLSSRMIVIGIVGIVFILAITRFFIADRVPNNLVIEATIPQKVFFGIPFEAKVAVVNYAGQELSQATLSLMLPPGVAQADAPVDRRVIVRDFGSLGEGERREERFELVIYDREVSLSALRATMTYVFSHSPARFEEVKNIPLAFQGDGLRVSLDYPPTIREGEEFIIKLLYENMSDDVIPQATLALQASDGMRIESIAPKNPETGNFVLGDVASGKQGYIELRARIVRVGEGDGSLRVVAMSNFRMSISRIIADETFILSLASSPITFQITVDGSPSSVGRGDVLRYVVSYENMTNEELRDSVITMRLTGDMFDFGTLVTDGVWNVFERTIRWDSFTTHALQNIGPRARGEVSFAVQMKSAYPIQRLSDRNMSVRVEGLLTSPSRIGGSLESFSRVARSEIKVRGELLLDAYAVFRDALSGILNTGSLPFRVNQRTDLTVHLKLMNYVTDMSAIRVRGTLAQGAIFTNQYVNNASGTTVSYDPVTREFVWDIPRLSATRGVLDAPLELIVQIGVVPRAENLEGPAPIFESLSIAATDDFIGIPFTSTHGAFTSAEMRDVTVGVHEIIVVP